MKRILVIVAVVFAFVMSQNVFAQQSSNMQDNTTKQETPKKQDKKDSKKQDKMDKKDSKKSGSGC